MFDLLDNRGYSTSSKYYDSTEQILAAAAPVIITFVVVTLILWALTLAGNWFLFKKAGRPGWKSLIPVYNNYILFDIADLNPWLSLLLLVPGVNIIMSFVVDYKIAQAFGRGIGFMLGLVLLPPAFVWLLGVSDKYEYQLAKGKNIPFGAAFERPDGGTIPTAEPPTPEATDYPQDSPQ